MATLAIVAVWFPTKAVWVVCLAYRSCEGLCALGMDAGRARRYTPTSERLRGMRPGSRTRTRLSVYPGLSSPWKYAAVAVGLPEWDSFLASERTGAAAVTP